MRNQVAHDCKIVSQKNLPFFISLVLTLGVGCSGDDGSGPAFRPDAEVSDLGSGGDSMGTGGAGSTGGTLSTGGTASGGANALGSGGDVSGATGGSGGTTEGSGGADGSGGGSDGSGGSAGETFSVCSSPPPVGTQAVTIFVIGDSTASEYAANVYPRMGWGQVLGDYYSPPCAKVIDKALSGRSSKSFLDEGAWTPVKNALKPGDYVLIQFGHNDEKSDDPTRYTVPGTTYKQHLTTYVKETRAKQAIPILLTSIHRNGWNGTTLKDSHGAYLTAVRELATDLDVELVDLAALTKSYFESIGPAATNELFMNLAAGAFPNYPSGNSDNTHLRESGARVVAQLFNAEVYAQQLPIATFLKAVPAGP